MTVVSIDGLCEWDSSKDLINRKKHGLSFETTSAVFYDEFFIEESDREHSENEERYRGIGNINGIVIITVFYTERTSDGITRKRIISSRRATLFEEERYEHYIHLITGSTERT
ncbi:MAG: BrnT family toxin [Treponema sp.]|nr:BrnT family toxin [Treponema sp.]